MAASLFSGPTFVTGNLTNLPPATTGAGVLDYNLDAGPSAEYQGDGIIDVRFYLNKDKVAGYTGVVACHFNVPSLCGVSAVPAALGAANIAAAQNVTNGTPMTLASANATGITLNVPIMPYTGILNGSATATTAAIALDFGFEFGNVTSGSTSIPVASGLDFTVGMPLVIGGVGNAAGTAPLLTNVVSISGNTIVVANTPLHSLATAPIGTGNLWGPSINGFPTPTAALPALGVGPGNWLDPRQTLMRGVRIVGVAGGTGGTFTVSGADVYGFPQTQLLTAAAGAGTVWSTKTFKYIYSVTPNFTDAHNYSVGTSDVFGLQYRTPIWDLAEIYWAATYMNTSTGYVAPDGTSPATSTTGDVRGTIQTSANGGGTGIGSTASNGAISSLVMTGNRFSASLYPNINQAGFTTAANPVPLFGVTPA